MGEDDMSVGPEGGGWVGVGLVHTPAWVASPSHPERTHTHMERSGLSSIPVLLSRSHTPLPLLEVASAADSLSAIACCPLALLPPPFSTISLAQSVADKSTAVAEYAGSVAAVMLTSAMGTAGTGAQNATAVDVREGAGFKFGADGSEEKAP